MQRLISPSAARSKPTAEPKPCSTCARIRAAVAAAALAVRNTIKGSR